MTGMSIHTIILENTDAHFVISEERRCVEDSWDAFPRLHTRTQHSRVAVPLERHPAPSWTSGKLDSTMWAVPLCVGKGQVGASSEDKALKLKSSSVLYRKALLRQHHQQPQLKCCDT